MTIPHLYHRHPEFAELVFEHRPNVASWDVSADFGVDNAFTTPTAIANVQAGVGYRSAWVRRRGLGFTQYTERGRTRAYIRWDDGWTAGSTVAHNHQTAFVRAREVFFDGTTGAWGPILVVPPPSTFATPRPFLTIRGTAPSIATPADNMAPSTAMHIVFPKFADRVTFTTTTSTPMQVAIHRGMELQEIIGDASVEMTDGTVNEVLLIGTGGAAAFDLRAALVNGEMA